MKIIVQVVSKSTVKHSEEIRSIKQGYNLLVGIEESDDEKVIIKMAEKIIKLRIIPDEQGKLNQSIKQVNGEVLSISQFTLIADCKQNRPSFTKACKFQKAKQLFELFNQNLEKENICVKTGFFGEDMQVSITNEGPITIILDSNII